MDDVFAVGCSGQLAARRSKAVQDQVRRRSRRREAGRGAPGGGYIRWTPSVVANAHGDLGACEGEEARRHPALRRPKRSAVSSRRRPAVGEVRLRGAAAQQRPARRRQHLRRLHVQVVRPLD